MLRAKVVWFEMRPVKGAALALTAPVTSTMPATHKFKIGDMITSRASELWSRGKGIRFISEARMKPSPCFEYTRRVHKIKLKTKKRLDSAMARTTKRKSCQYECPYGLQMEGEDNGGQGNTRLKVDLHP
jgi:hypothetical protein